jgi:hypothetical protein
MIMKRVLARFIDAFCGFVDFGLQILCAKV